MIELFFYSFNTESQVDYLSVYDGDSTSSPLIGQFSGSSLPAPMTSSSTKLYLRFTSDRAGTSSGFVARYQGIFSLKNMNKKSNCLIEAGFLRNLMSDGPWMIISKRKYDDKLVNLRGLLIVFIFVRSCFFGLKSNTKDKTL